MQNIETFINQSRYSDEIKKLASKCLKSERLTVDEAVFLYENSDLDLLSMLSTFANSKINGDKVYYNKNIHIEPTNICYYDCLFCSYSHRHSEAYEFTINEIVDKVKALDDGITEIHIVGAVHPERDLYYYSNMISRVRKIKPNAHIKAFTAIEIEYMCRKSNMSIAEGLEILQRAGLNSLPGGGAEIFSKSIRNRICQKKLTSNEWLDIHRTAHKMGIPSNATILYGHIESLEDRFKHLEEIRSLQGETNGFNAFIPLKYKSKNNNMQEHGETPLVDDLKNYAMTRLFLDNVPHLKAYWPMIGKQNAILALSFGVDDLDGTINNSTTIYTAAGSEETNPEFSESEIRQAITKAGKTPVERDSLYNPL